MVVFIGTCTADPSHSRSPNPIQYESRPYRQYQYGISKNATTKHITVLELRRSGVEHTHKSASKNHHNSLWQCNAGKPFRVLLYWCVFSLPIFFGPIFSIRVCAFNIMDNAHVIDLTSPTSSSATRAASIPSVAAALPNRSPVEVIDLIPSAARRKNPPGGAAFKTDPNNRKPNPHRHKRQRRTVDPPVVRATPELQVLEVFPDCELAHIQKLFQQGFVVETAIQFLADNSYPKTKHTKPPPGNGISLEGNTKGQYKYDYMSPSSFQPTDAYVSAACNQLLKDFPYLKKRSVKLLMQQSKNHYAIAHDKIINIAKGPNQKTDDIATVYKRVAVATNQRNVPAYKATVQWLHQQPGNFFKLNQSVALADAQARKDPILSQEIQYVNGKLTEWLRQTKQTLDRQKHKEESVRNGTAVECSCCFDATDIQDMVACQQEGHLFCCECVQSFCENKIFGTGNLGVDAATKKPALELLCFHGEGCSSGFSRDSLVKALPAKTLEKYDTLQFQMTIQRAGMDVVTCPQCGFQAEKSSDTQRVFACPVVTCRFESW